MKCALKHIYLEVEAEPKYFEMKKYTGEYRSLEIKYKLLSSFEETYCTVYSTYILLYSTYTRAHFRLR